MSNTAITASELNSIHNCSAMEFNEDLWTRIIKIGLVRKEYSISWLKAGHSSDMNKQAMEGIKWCNSELEKLLNII